MKHNIAILITSFNRHDDIKRLLASINTAYNQSDKKRLGVKVFLVDNSEDNNLSELTLSLSIAPDFEFIHEAKKGLSNARNTGIKEILKGDFDYVCTIDDDIVLPEDYFDRVVKTINSNPFSWVIGGRVELFDKRDLPVTIKTSLDFEEFDGIHIFGFVFGCALIIKVEAFKAIGFFDPLLGAGTDCGGSEDSDFVFRVWCFEKSNNSVIYFPDYFVYHNHGRREKTYTDALLKNYSLGQGGFFIKHMLFSPKIHTYKLIYWAFTSSESRVKFKKLTYRVRGAIRYLKSRFFSRLNNNR